MSSEPTGSQSTEHMMTCNDRVDKCNARRYGEDMTNTATNTPQYRAAEMVEARNTVIDGAIDDRLNRDGGQP